MIGAKKVSVTATAVLIPQLGILSSAAIDHPSESVDLDLVERIGRRGQRFNTRSTLLALAAVKEIVDSMGTLTSGLGAGTALVAASTYGNYFATCGVAQQLETGGVQLTSPMDLPNASSNIVASQIAIRFGIKGVCLTVDDGHRSGEGVLGWASRLLASGRVSRVVVVCAESPSVYEDTLRAGKPLLEGAVAMLLEPGGGLDPKQDAASALPAWSDAFELASLGGLLRATRESVCG